MSTTPHWTDTTLAPLGACSDAMVWAKTTPSLAEAWATCTRGDWLLWLWGRHCGGRMDDRRKPLVLAACECARLALPIFEARQKSDDRPRKAIETAERWAKGEPVTREELADAADAAYADAAYAAAYAAAAADAADAAYAAYAADAAADAAYDAAAYAAAARHKALSQCADIVRTHMPTPAFIGGAK